MILFHRAIANRTSSFDHETLSACELKKKKSLGGPTKVATPIQSMKHSHKHKKPKGFSEGRNKDVEERSGPITIEDIMSKGRSYHELDTAIHKMVM